MFQIINGLRNFEENMFSFADIIVAADYQGLLGTSTISEMTNVGSCIHNYGLVHERHNSIADALEWCLSCTNPLISDQQLKGYM